MLKSQSRVKKVIEIPADVNPAVIVGRGGSQSKQIASTHNVRCYVIFDKRLVQLDGLRDGVDGATADVLDLFDAFRLERQRLGEAAQRPQTIHKVAVKIRRRDSVWRFERRQSQDIDADPSTMKHVYRLVELAPMHSVSGFDASREGDGAEWPELWITAFGSTMHNQIKRDLGHVFTNGEEKIKVKVAFGLQCFDIPDSLVANRTAFTWTKLQSLQLHSDLRLRWSNIVPHNSLAVRHVLDELEEETDAPLPSKTELVVYINSRSRGTSSDISVKYRWEHNEWVLRGHRPQRVAHGLYNIAVDNDTAFRVRVYSRTPPTSSLDYDALVDGLDITVKRGDDPFSTLVEADDSFPPDKYIRQCVVQTSKTVEWHGLRFTISYMDGERQKVSLACRLSRRDEDHECEVSASVDSVQTLVEKVTSMVETAVE